MRTFSALAVTADCCDTSLESARTETRQQVIKICKPSRRLMCSSFGGRIQTSLSFS